MEELIPDDQRLVELLRHEETLEDALTEINRKYRAKVQAYLMKRFGLAEAVAEELFCASLYKTYEGISGLSSPLAFKSWFYRIAVNTALQWVRDNASTRDCEQFLDDQEWRKIADERASDDPGLGGQGGLEVEALRRAWEQLDRTDQEVLWCTVVYPEFGTKALAAELGIGRDAVRQRKRRALAKLKELCLRQLKAGRATAKAARPINLRI